MTDTKLSSRTLAWNDIRERIDFMAKATPEEPTEGDFWPNDPILCLLALTERVINDVAARKARRSGKTQTRLLGLKARLGYERRALGSPTEGLEPSAVERWELLDDIDVAADRAKGDRGKFASMIGQVLSRVYELPASGKDAVRLEALLTQIGELDPKVAGYRNAVHNLERQRHNIIQTDGHGLFRRETDAAAGWPEPSTD